MPMMLVGSGSWSDGLIELPLYQLKAVNGFNDFAPTSNLVPWGHAALVTSGCGAMDGEIWRIIEKSENTGTGEKSENNGTGSKSENNGTGTKLSSIGLIRLASRAACAAKSENTGTG